MRAKTINEVQNFERGQDPKDSMGIGLWKPYEPGIFVPIEEFENNGGKLEVGREIFNAGGVLNGYWKKYDDNQRVHIISGEGFKSRPAQSFATVKIPAKIMYK